MNTIKLTDEEIKLISDAIAREIYGYGLPKVDYKALKRSGIHTALFTAPEWEITNESDTTFEGTVWIGDKVYTVVASVPSNNWFCMEEWPENDVGVCLPPEPTSHDGWFNPYENWYEF